MLRDLERRLAELERRLDRLPAPPAPPDDRTLFLRGLSVDQLRRLERVAARLPEGAEIPLDIAAALVAASSDEQELNT